MTAPRFQNYHLAAEHARLTIAAALKRLLPDRPWTQVRKLIAGRRVQLNGNLCVDEKRKVQSGDVLKLWNSPLAPPVSEEAVRLAYVDDHVIVVHKPAGVTTLRHREETDLPQRRKQLQPTLDELVTRLLARHLGIRHIATSGRGTDKRLRIRAVHRLDRDTSGVMLFARTPKAEQKLIRMFARHEVQRAYVAIVHGRVEEQTIKTWLVRDRGDGLRGSAPVGEGAAGALRAVTHVRPMEHVPPFDGDSGYTILECRLETGRTHQIRIHLSEIGHRLCGEKTYTHLLGQKSLEDVSGAPRQALHAAELAFRHPNTGQALRFRMPLPRDMKEWLLKLRHRSVN